MRQRALKPCLIRKCKLKSLFDLMEVLLPEGLGDWATFFVLIVSALGGDLKDSESHL
jgi:hypothetical protein